MCGETHQKQSCHPNCLKFNSSCGDSDLIQPRDGIGIKPGLEYDPIRKLLVGTSVEIDLQFIKVNPIPDLRHLRNIMIKDAETIVVTDLTHTTNLPIGQYRQLDTINKYSNLTRILQCHQDHIYIRRKMCFPLRRIPG